MSLSEVARLLWRAIWFERRLQPRILKSPKCAAATRPGRAEIGESKGVALAAVGRERGNPRTERSEAAALKVQLCEVGFRGEGDHFRDFRCRAGLLERKLGVSENRVFQRLKSIRKGQSMRWNFWGAKPNLHLFLRGYSK